MTIMTISRAKLCTTVTVMYTSSRLERQWVRRLHQKSRSMIYFYTVGVGALYTWNTYTVAEHWCTEKDLQTSELFQANSFKMHLLCQFSIQSKLIFTSVILHDSEAMGGNKTDSGWLKETNHVVFYSALLLLDCWLFSTYYIEKACFVCLAEACSGRYVNQSFSIDFLCRLKRIFMALSQFDLMANFMTYLRCQWEILAF